MMAKEIFAIAAATIGVVAVGAFGYWWIFKHEYVSSPQQHIVIDSRDVVAATTFDAIERHAQQTRRAGLFTLMVASIGIVGCTALLRQHNYWFDKCVLGLSTAAALVSCYHVRQASNEIAEIAAQRNQQQAQKKEK